MTVETYLADLATHLQTLSYGTLGKPSSGVAIQIGGYYESTDNAIFITPYDGADVEEILSGEDDASRPYFQILVRNSNHATCKSTADSLYRLLRKKYDWDVGSTYFISLRAKAPPIFIRKTNGGFYEYVLNFKSSMH